VDVILVLVMCCQVVLRPWKSQVSNQQKSQKFSNGTVRTIVIAFLLFMIIAIDRVGS
jgi:hypothetical protein